MRKSQAKYTVSFAPAVSAPRSIMLPLVFVILKLAPIRILHAWMNCVYDSCSLKSHDQLDLVRILQGTELQHYSDIDVTVTYYLYPIISKHLQMGV